MLQGFARSESVLHNFLEHLNAMPKETISLKLVAESLKFQRLLGLEAALSLAPCNPSMALKGQKAPSSSPDPLLLGMVLY